MTFFKALISLAILVLLTAPVTILATTDDAPGSYDHRLFPRFKPNYYHLFTTITEQNDHFEFVMADGKEQQVDGKVYKAIYGNDMETEASSQAEIVDYFKRIIEGMGGTKLFDGYDERHGPIQTYRFEREGKEFWVEVRVAGDGADYVLTVVERDAPEKSAKPAEKGGKEEKPPASKKEKK